MFNVVSKLEERELVVDCFDPVASAEEVLAVHGIKMVENISLNTYAGIIIAVGHTEFLKWGHKKIRSFGLTNSILYDVKSIFDKQVSDMRL